MNSAKRSVFILASCQALMLTAMVLAMTLGALVGHELAADKSLATLPVAASVIGTALASTAAAFAIARFGWRGGFLLGTALGAAGGLVATYATATRDFWGFVSGYFLTGVYQAFGNFYRFAAAESVPPEDRAKAVSWTLAGGVIAAIAGPEIVKWARHGVASGVFTGAFLAQAALAGLAAILLLFLRLPRHAVAQTEGESGRSLSEILRQPVAIVATSGAAIGYGVMILAMTAAPLAMVHHHHPVQTAAFAIQAHVLGMFAPSFATGTLIQRFGVLRIMAAGTLLLAGHVAIAVSGTATLHFVSALVLLGVGWNFLYIGGTTLLTKAYTPAERARTQAANDLLVFGVVAAASLSSGWLLHHLGWQAVNWSALPFLAALLGAIAWLGWRSGVRPAQWRSALKQRG